MTPLICPTSKTPWLVQEIGSISYIGRVIANFVLKFPFFRYHGDKGPSGLNVNGTVELPDLENPLVGASDKRSRSLI